MTIPQKYTELHKRLSEIHTVFNAVVSIENDYAESITETAEQDIYHAEKELIELNNTMTSEDAKEIFGDESILRMGTHETCQGLYSITFESGIIVEFVIKEEMFAFICLWSKKTK